MDMALSLTSFNYSYGSNITASVKVEHFPPPSSNLQQFHRRDCSCTIDSKMAETDGAFNTT